MTVYQVCAHDYSPRGAAEEFARKWFADGPREIEYYNPETNTFRLANGIATYAVKYIPEIRLVSTPLWRVERIEK